ncbi:MAG: 50S ribosomal protein L6 [Chloroflexota bacterium]|nr:50S ribosomal protein L6 [Chloroflexota bacterium]
MSRVGKRPILVPPGVQVAIEGKQVTVKGPKGTLARTFRPEISIELKDSQVIVSRPSDDKLHRSLHGLTRTLVANMVEGVSKGFRKTLEINGVGYRAQKAGEKITLQVGYSQPKEMVPPPGISLEVEGTNRIHVVGIDKELVGETAARLRRVRPPDPYKGKGIKYADEKLRLKAGKAGKVGAKR